MTAEAVISRIAATGLAVTRSFDVDRWNILPWIMVLFLLRRLRLKSPLELETQTNSSFGNVRQLSLTFSPDFRTSLTIKWLLVPGINIFGQTKVT